MKPSRKIRVILVAVAALTLAAVYPDVSSDGDASVVSSTAEYLVTFESTWSEATHPDEFPSNPHFSGLIGATHDATVTFWEAGALASPGIQSMAETGRKSPMDAEVNAAIQSGSAERLLSGGGISRSPGSVSLTFSVSEDFPLVTLVSMLAPSPDWFVGVAGLNLFEGGNWADSVVVDLFAYDAGTDSGPTYTAPNQATDPPTPIALIQESPFQVGGTVPPVGRFTFIRQSAVAVEVAPSEVPETHTLSMAYPNPFNPQAAFTLSVRQAQRVRLEVFDLGGRRVDTLFDGLLQPGAPHRFTLDGATWPSGVYVYRAVGEVFSESRAVVLVR